MARPFFPTSREALDSITALYDFLWPTAAALWNMRWQVRGYCAARPGVDSRELTARFVAGSGIHGANLTRACLDTTWPAQQEVLAGVLLTNLFAVYEGWAKRTLKLLGQTDKASSDNSKKLQYPGVISVLKSLIGPTSTLLTQTTYPIACDDARYASSTDGPNGEPAEIENLIACYRYFKEVRNKQIHDHGIADLNCVRAYERFAKVATTKGLGIAEIPIHRPVSQGQQVKLDLRGVVGFSHVLQRLLYTIDAELSQSVKAESVLADQWLQIRPLTRPFKAEASERRRQIRSTFAKLGFTDIAVTEVVEMQLKSLGLARW